MRRVALGAASALLAIAAAASGATPMGATPPTPSLADSLAPATWGMTLPTGWFAAPLPHVRSGDLIDVLAVRHGDRAYAVPVAYAARVMTSDERGVVIEVDEEDASAIAIARGGGLLLIPLLRSTR